MAEWLEWPEIPFQSNVKMALILCSLTQVRTCFLIVYSHHFSFNPSINSQSWIHVTDQILRNFADQANYCSLGVFPPERHSKCTKQSSERLLIVGLKNIASSSGWAITNKIECCLGRLLLRWCIQTKIMVVKLKARRIHLKEKSISFRSSSIIGKLQQSINNLKPDYKLAQKCGILDPHMCDIKERQILEIVEKNQYIYKVLTNHMQSDIDWTTGGLKFYNADPQKTENMSDFVSNADINKNFDPMPSTLPMEERIKLIKSVGEEVIGSDEMIRDKLESKKFPKAYDGFEPSGRMHIAQGLLRSVNVNKMVDAGCIFIFWVADYFAMLNGKFDGDLEKIRTVGKYFVEVWKAAGMKLSNVKFIWASEEINRRSNEYWMRVMDIACKNSIARIQKCATIMGKKQSDQLKVSQLFYPCMQCADIFFLDVDFCQLGVDQRKVNMLAVEYAKNQKQKPVIVSHGMISGLIEGQEKMSKSNPDSAIFMQDSVKDVEKKIKKAFCPEKDIENNPVIDYCQKIIFGMRDSLQILRKPENGGDKLYKSFEELAADYKQGALHPGDLKPAVAKVLNQLIEPVRKHFQTDPQAKALIAKIKSFKKDEPAVMTQMTEQAVE